MLRRSGVPPAEGTAPPCSSRPPVYDRLVTERGDIPVQVRGEADRIHRDPAQILRQTSTPRSNTPSSAFEPKQPPRPL